MTLAAEERFPDQCFRLRYEDLVTAPEAVMADLFEFLGVAPAPGISEACFSSERERFGPADYKIWYTSKISPDSVGRGWSVPVGMIAPQLLGMINELAGKLGYLAIDGDWGARVPPTDLRVPAIAPPGGQAPASQPGGSPAAEGARTAVKNKRPGAAATGWPVHSARLGERLRAGLTSAACAGRADRWGTRRGETFVVVAVTKDPEHPADYWLVDLGQATVTRATEEAQEDSDFDLVGTVSSWEKVIDGEMNLSVALRSCAVRYCDNGETAPLAADGRITILAQLLGVGP